MFRTDEIHDYKLLLSYFWIAIKLYITQISVTGDWLIVIS